MLDLWFYNFYIFLIHLINKLFCLLIYIVIISFSECLSVCVHIHALYTCKGQRASFGGFLFLLPPFGS